MIQLLRSIFGKPPREYSLDKPVARAKPVRLNGGGDYRAVSLEPSRKCHAACQDGANRRYLLGEVPRLPLANCTMPDHCACKFRKYADRRDGDRRLLGETDAHRWFACSERRAAKRRS
jgi:hypothetical protein